MANDNDLIRRGDAMEAVYDQHPEWTRDAIAALPADDRVAKLVEALREIGDFNLLPSHGDPFILRDHARAALAAWEAGK